MASMLTYWSFVTAVGGSQVASAGSVFSKGPEAIPGVHETMGEVLVPEDSMPGISSVAWEAGFGLPKAQPGPLGLV